MARWVEWEDKLINLDQVFCIKKDLGEFAPLIIFETESENIEVYSFENDEERDQAFENLKSTINMPINTPVKE